MTAPLISVLVTVFNRELYLAQTLISILESSFADFELIIVDDASTDSSAAVASEFLQADRRVRLFRNQKNLGDYGNRIKAASLTHCKYLKYVDSDDIVYRHTLAAMVESMEANPSAVIGLSHSIPDEVKPYPWFLSPGEAYKKHFLGRGCLSCGPSGAIIRRQEFEAVGGFDPSWGVLSDTDLWLRMAARWGVLLLPPGLVWWRRHEGQEFTAAGAKEKYLEGSHQLDMRALNSTVCPLSKEERKAAIARTRQHFSRRLLSLALVNKQPRRAFEMYRKSGLGMRELARGFLPYR